MKRIYHHFEKWEDWREGLYARSLGDADEIIVSRSARLLANSDRLRAAMMDAICNWPRAAEVNLSNRSRNRQAYLGQAACCFVCGSHETLTKMAWHRLSAAEKIKANQVADEIISAWENRCQSKE